MGSCAFALNNAAYRCVPDTTAAIPVWQGGNFNYVKGVYDNFFIMKARIMNLMSVEKWDWDQYDHVTNEFAVSPEFWTTAKFTLFVFWYSSLILSMIYFSLARLTSPEED